MQYKIYFKETNAVENACCCRRTRTARKRKDVVWQNHKTDIDAGLVGWLESARALPVTVICTGFQKKNKINNNSNIFECLRLREKKMMTLYWRWGLNVFLFWWRHITACCLDSDHVGLARDHFRRDRSASSEGTRPHLVRTAKRKDGVVRQWQCTFYMNNVLQYGSSLFHSLRYETDTNEEWVDNLQSVCRLADLGSSR